MQGKYWSDRSRVAPGLLFGEASLRHTTVLQQGLLGLQQPPVAFWPVKTSLLHQKPFLLVPPILIPRRALLETGKAPPDF